MTDYYFSASRSNETTLCLSPLTSRHIAAAGQDLPGDGGYFLYERSATNRDHIRIIAQVLSEEAAFELRDLLSLD